MRRVVGGILFALGILTIFSSPIALTGFFVSEGWKNAENIFGIVFVIFGMILLSNFGSLEKRILDSGEKQQIKSAFRQWNGRLTGAQKQILRRYGIQTEKTGSGHLAFYFPGVPTKIYASSTPSDQRTGLNFTLKLLIPYIEENYSKRDGS